MVPPWAVRLAAASRPSSSTTIIIRGLSSSSSTTTVYSTTTARRRLRSCTAATQPHPSSLRRRRSLTTTTSTTTTTESTTTGSTEQKEIWMVPSTETFDHMTRIVQQHQQSNNNNTNNTTTTISIYDQTRALEFWLSKAARDFLIQRDGHDTVAIQNSLTLVLQPQQQEQQPNKKNTTTAVHRQDLLLRLVYLLLRPLSGTQAALAQWGRRNSRVTPKIALPALFQATRVMDRAVQVQQTSGGTTTTTTRNEQEQRAILNLWSKRGRFLSRCLKKDTSPSREIRTWVQHTGLSETQMLHALGGTWDASTCVHHIREMIDDQLSSLDVDDDDDPPPVSSVIATYTYLLGSLADCGQPQEAMAVLENLEEKLPSIVQDSQADILYCAVLSAFQNQAAQGDGVESLDQAEKWWQGIENRKTSVTHSPVALSTLMNMKSVYGHVGQSEELLFRCRDSGSMQPSVVHYNICLKGWALEARKPGMTEFSQQRAQALLSNMQEQGICPDHISYTAVINTLLALPNDEDVARAEAILDQIENDDSVRLDSILYNEFMRRLLSCLGASTSIQVQENMARHAERIFRRCPKPGVKELNTCLTCWSQSFTKMAARQMLALFQEYCVDSKTVTPDSHTYRTLLKGLGATASPRFLQPGRDLLKMMEKDGVPYHIGVLNQYVRLLVRCGRNLAEAQQFLFTMEHNYNTGKSTLMPQENTYRYILAEYYKYPDRIEEANRLFTLLKERSAENSQLNPRMHTYTAMVQAWGASRRPEALERVEELFAEMKDMGVPNSYAYGVYQTAWMKSGRPDACERVEGIVEEMEKEFNKHGDTRSRASAHNFAIAMNCWAFSGRSGAAERVELILEHLEELSQKGRQWSHLRPTAENYRAAIQAWAQSNEPQQKAVRAIALLDRMENKYDADNPDPRRLCYHAAMRAIGRSTDPRKVELIEDLFMRMSHRSLHLTPNLGTYVIALTYLSSVSRDTAQSSQALQVARTIVDTHLANGEAEPKVFEKFLALVGRLLPDGKRDPIVRSFVTNWPRRILLLPSSQRALRGTVSIHLAKELLSPPELEHNGPRAHTIL